MKTLTATTKLKTQNSAYKGQPMRPTFYSPQDFPKLAALSQHWQTMAAEIHTLNSPVLEIDRIGKTRQQVIDELTLHMQQGGEYGWLKGWGKEGGNNDWVQLALVIQDEVIPFAQQLMPKTISLLRELKGIKVCALAKMLPHSFLPCHQHPEILTEGLLQMHITLDAPSEERNYCYLNVNGDFRQHLPGSMMIFDGSLDHFAVNASFEERTILYMEFHREQLG